MLFIRELRWLSGSVRETKPGQSSENFALRRLTHVFRLTVQAILVSESHA